jgi:hypothetical protein
MHLKRIRVPNFRVLKDVDISFEPDLVPRIFPLGSINGGGKSTLLQLIFTLLHCPGEYERIPYLQNMLDGFEFEDNSNFRDLANIELVVDGQEIELDFFVCDRDYIINDVNLVVGDNKISPLDPDLKISHLVNLQNSLENGLEFILKIKTRLETLIKNINSREIKKKNSEFNDIFETFFNGFTNINISEQEIKSIERFVANKRIRDLSLELNQLKIDSEESKHIATELLGSILNINRAA